MLKIIGSIMILFACVMFSFIKADELKQKCDNLNRMKKAVYLIKNEIAFSSKTLSEAICYVSQLMPHNISLFFKSVSEYLLNNETSDFSQAWEASKNEFDNKLLLSDEADKILDDLAQQLGKMPRDSELENIDRTLEILSNQYCEEEKSYKKNRKMIFSLGLCAGLAVLILFI